MKLEKFVKSCSSSLDKLHGQKKAIDYSFSGSERYDFRDDEYGEAKRKEVEEAVGKAVYVIDKGWADMQSFFNTVEKTEPGEIRKVTDNIYTIQFEDFSVYQYRSKHYGVGYGANYFMDCKEVILPPKNKVEKSSKRIYIISMDRKIFYLPELEYPRIIAKLLIWLKKKKKISFKEKPVIWSFAKEVGLETCQGEQVILNSRWAGAFYEGYPIRNIKSKSDLNDYNLWLGSDFRAMVETHNKSCLKLAKTNSFWNSEVMGPLSPLNPTEIAITQEDVDQFISETNKRYQVKR